jgi:hypothetical protein
MRILLQCLLLAVAGASASPVIAKTLDLRKQTDADGGSREISFCARPSSEKPVPGHAFIAFSETTREGKRTFRAIGHTAFSVSEALVSYTGLVTATGALVDEKYTSLRQRCLTLQVNKADYDRSYRLAMQPLKSIGIVFDESRPILKAYSLAAEDCVGFMMQQAILFVPRINVPVRRNGELPLNYVRRLIDEN